MTFINLTPHAVVVIGEDGTILADIPPSGTVARITESVTFYGSVVGIPIGEVRLGDIEGLPPAHERDGSLCIVSMPLLMGARAMGISSTDLVYPYGQVRDETGRIVGCRSLATLSTGYADGRLAPEEASADSM